jgi:3-deoxy-D-manno-octulosonic acid kinase
MRQAQVQPVSDGAVLFDADLPMRVDPAWLDADYWKERSFRHETRGGRGAALYVDTPLGACVLRHYRRGGLAARLSTDRYVWAGAARTRSFREFRLLASLQADGLPVPVPVAARYQRRGAVYRADLLTRRIPQAHTLAEVLAARALDAGAADSVGSALARFHRAGVWHADLNAHNVLIDVALRAWLVDFDRGRRRPPALSWQQANITRLRRSFDKLGAARQQADFDASFWHPMLGAYHRAMAAPAAVADAAPR